ncbi:MAG: Mur ligase domain-containing protein, partial [Anaerolineae bacterium]
MISVAAAAPAVAASGAARPAIAWPQAPGVPELHPGDAVYLVGIRGAGMSGLARVLAARGLRVAGSDVTAGSGPAKLGGHGIVVHVGHSAGNLPQDCRLVVASPAVPADSPELREARRRGIAITKRAVLIGALMDSGRGVAVAGTHGKSTTAGLMAHVLSQAGLDPTFFVGARLPDLGTNARSGGDLLVVEADEYDGSFLHGCPWLAIVTNVEHDHPDCYPTADDVATAFGAFVSRVQADGLVVAWAGSGTT